jgi:hypothetical protein
VRRARQLAPIDRFEGASEAEWALAAVLHDVAQATHPDFNATFRRRSPGRLLDIADATLDRVAGPPTVKDALSRHAWFARVFEITRTDVVVSWWVGSRTFLGTDPPARLTAWPEFRRVQVEKTPRPLVDLPANGASVDAGSFAITLGRFLSKTPLTDLATLGRATPAFAWSEGTLSLVGAGAGRALALRAIERHAETAGEDAVDAALGRATRALLVRRDWRALAVALELLSGRMLGEVERLPRAPAQKLGMPDVAFARAAGALAAMQALESGKALFGSAEQRRLLAVLEPFTRTPQGGELRAALAAGRG